MREHIRKLIFVEIWNQGFAEGGEPFVQETFFNFVLERFGDDAADDAGRARHAFGHVLGRADGLRLLREKGFEKISKFSFTAGD